MFFLGSRYEKAGTYQTAGPRGATVTVTNLPLPHSGPLAGTHRLGAGQRLDHVAARYLGDATAFWRLCDANNAMVPDMLAARQLVGIPAGGG